MSKIITLIPSKDRAAQLDLCINSLLTNFDVSDIVVIYKASNKKYEEGYSILKQKHRNNGVFLVPQMSDNMKTEVFNNVSDVYKIINFCTDDTVFYKYSNLEEGDVLEILNDDVISFSPRLGLNTILQNYMTGELQSNLDNYYRYTEKHLQSIIKWKWQHGNPLHNYYYPAHQDGCLMNLEYFKKIADFLWTTLRGLEGTLAIDRRHTMFDRPYMASPTESFAVNIPINAVQGGLYCSNKYFQDPQIMNDRFLHGEILSLEKTDFSHIIGSHEERGLVWD